MANDKFARIMRHLLNGEVYWNHLTGEAILYDEQFDEPPATLSRGVENTFCLAMVNMRGSDIGRLNIPATNDRDIDRDEAVMRIISEDGWHMSNPYVDNYYLSKAKEA